MLPEDAYKCWSAVSTAVSSGDEWERDSVRSSRRAERHVENWLAFMGGAMQASFEKAMESPSSIVSFQSELPEPLHRALTIFIERHPLGINTVLFRRRSLASWFRTGLNSVKSPAFRWATCSAENPSCAESESGSRPLGQGH